MIFAKDIGIIENSAKFEAIDGMHTALIQEEQVELGMQDVEQIEDFTTYYFLNTGSPHHVELVQNLKDFNVKTKGAEIRYGQPYNEAGSNVNFVNQLSNDVFAVRTYERGVEDETLSCGTGVTAVAIAMHKLGKTKSNIITLKTEGGKLKISFEVAQDGSYKNICLIGPATQVFKGEIL